MRLPWRRASGEVEEELRSHLRMAVADRIARGEDPVAAQAAARRELGNVTHIAELTREASGGVWVETALQDLRYAARLGRRSPGFTAVAVLALALGIAATTLVYGARRMESASVRRLPSPQQLIYVGQGPTGCLECVEVSFATYLAIHDRTPSLEHLSLSADWEPVLRGTFTGGLVDAAQVTPGLFRALGIGPMFGRTFVPEDGTPAGRQVVVLSETLWRSRFGSDTGIIGRAIVLNRTFYTVVGVVPARAEYPAGTQLWVPLVPAGDLASDPNAVSFRAIARLADGATIEAAEADIATIGGRLAAALPESMIGTSLRVGPLLELEENRSTGDVASIVYGSAVAILLLISCINLAGLLIARLDSRRRELAVRRALGAASSRIARQLMLETLVITGLASVAGLLLAFSATRLTFGVAVQLDASTFGVALATGVLTSMVVGLWPSVRAARSGLEQELRQSAHSTTGTRSSLRGRRALVVTQVAMAVVLLAAAGTLARSLWNIYHVDAGFRTDGLLVLRLENLSPRSARANEDRGLDRLIAAIGALPGVESAGAALGLPFGHGAGRGRFEVDGRPTTDAESRPAVHMQAITGGYFGTIGIPVLRGRAFRDTDGPDAPRVAMVNRAFARRFFGGDDPRGRALLIDDARWEIVGIVADVFHGDVEQPARPEIYRPMQQWPSSRAWIAVRTRGDPRRLATAAVREVGRFDPDIAVTRRSTMDELRFGDTAAERRMLRVVGAFAMAAVLISAIGLYGLIAYSAAQRAREFGIRMALGAAQSTVRSMVLAEGLRLATIGVVIGAVAALGALRFMRGLLYEVSTRDPLTLGGVVAFVLTIAIAAAYAPARRATLIDPVRSLREE